MEKFSVLMSVYYKEKAEFLDLSLKSILIEQTVKPDEIVMVKDGILTDKLEEILKKYNKKFPNVFKFVELKKNMGLGYALQIGLKNCTYNLVMRMDTDDISVSDRFEKQLKYMSEHEDIVAVGGYISEFEQNYKNEVLRLKSMPCTYEEILKYAKFRNPLNHVTVCFRKKDVMEVGSYQSLLLVEDYYLWARLLIAGKRIANMDEVLVYVRIGNGFHERRGSKVSIASWKKLQEFLYNNKFINLLEKYRNILGMYTIVYAPSGLKKVLYSNFLRK